MLSSIVASTPETLGEVLAQSDSQQLESLLTEVSSPLQYGTFRLNFHRFDRFELYLRGHTQPQGAAFSCLRLKWADMVLI